MSDSRTPLSWWRPYRKQILAVLGVYIAILLTRAYFNYPASWLDVTMAYFVVANLLVLWWYADATWRQMRTVEHQYELSAKDYIERNKPVVFLERIEDAGRRGHFHYAVRNAGGGYAVNVFYYDITVVEPKAVGSLAAGEERVLPTNLDEYLCRGSAVKCIVVAEAPFTRTTQWTATLNLRTQEASDHQGQVLHRAALVKCEPPRFRDQSLQEFMRANGADVRAQLHALEADNLAAPLLDRIENDSTKG